MENNRHTLWERLARQVSGNASEENKAWVRQQGAQEHAIEEAMEEAGKVWADTALPDPAYEPDVENGWQRFQLRVQAREARLPVRKNRSFMWAVAATVAMLLLLGSLFLTRLNEPAWTEIRSAGTETRTIQLADGSQVTLNRNSTLSYPEDFQTENRTVRLEGEAFFEVARAEGKRFTIYARDTKTEVIGTSFNLRAYASDPVQVQVVTGKVAFARTGDDEAIFLEPGQEGVLAGKRSPPLKQAIEQPNFQAWKTKNLTFNDQPLEQLAAELERYFNISITIQNEALRNCRFTTSFREPDLQEVLDILAVTGNLTITQAGNRYIISGTGCK
jgi:transmembrane sensor